MSALDTISALHPTAWLHVGSKTHGGPEEYGYGCRRHGRWCREWEALNPALRVLPIRDGEPIEPDEWRRTRLRSEERVKQERQGVDTDG